ncbi:MAG: glucokinase [Bacteroidota bacterium]|nr:glucokinase [Bacteroidota bacterium]
MNQEENKKNFILAGDSGGTKTELALFKEQQGRLEKITSQKYFNKDFSNLEDIIIAFLKNKNQNNNFQIDSACIGIAGPVINGKVKSTNLSWELDEKVLSEKFKIKNFRLANDLEIIAAGVAKINEEDLITLYKGKGEKKLNNKVIIAPGTGLGQAVLIYNKGQCNILSTEGGHTDFAPSDEIEIELLKYLKKKFSHVSCERIASGLGMVNIFNFLREINYAQVSNEVLKRFETEDAAAVISEEGLKKQDKTCEKVLDIFASVLGAQSGNMVLNYKSTGGVYIGGKIPLLNIEKFKDGTFIKSYLNKGRLSYLVEAAPVYIIKNPSIGLIGAAMLSGIKD